MGRLAAVMMGVGVLIGGESAGAAEMDQSRDTATVVREAGVAMWRWLEAQPPSGEAALAVAKLARPDWETCSTSVVELRRLLVPKYIAVLPSTDGWGQDLQFCLQYDPARPERSALGVRSPGRDGKFASTYETGSFPWNELDQDMVWVNGYFIRWPAQAGASN